MKALDWAETFGNFVTIDICPSIYLASEVLNPKSCLHLATQRFQNFKIRHDRAAMTSEDTICVCHFMFASVMACREIIAKNGP